MHDPTDYEARHILGEPEALPSISSHLPDLVDSYITIREQRLAADRLSAQLTEAETDLKRTIIAKFQDQGVKALGGQLGLVKMTELDEPKAENWELIYDYIERNQAFHLLHKRLTTLAVKELWDDGKTVPGVGHEKIFKLSVSGVKK
jgi:hypothetical protein